MGREFELKFTAVPEQQAAIHGRFGSFTSVYMETTYYDTPDSSLSARHITLRRRMENGVSVCTVKTPADDHGRGEWETECEDIGSAIPVLCALGCPVDLPSLAAGGLVPICGARFTRLAKAVTAPGCTVELALDSGVLTGGGRELSLCEVEVELKSGSEEAAAAFARSLAAEFGLAPEKKSKFRRALALARGESHGIFTVF